MMTFDDPPSVRLPWISAPQRPTMVLFEPTLIFPLPSRPLT
jgi:hypothetical protein